MTPPRAGRPAWGELSVVTPRAAPRSKAWAGRRAAAAPRICTLLATVHVCLTVADGGCRDETSTAPQDAGIGERCYVRFTPVWREGVLRTDRKPWPYWC